MARLLRDDRAAADVMLELRAQDARRGRNDPCTCGGSRKSKHCHGNTAPSPGIGVATPA